MANNRTTELFGDVQGLSSNLSRREYVFTPADLPTKLAIVVILPLFGGFAVLANGLFLYLKWKKLRNPQFTRSLTMVFTASLAWSNVLCCIISLPLLATQIIVDVFQNDWGCRFARFMQICFPVITMFTLTVIGIERHIATYHPFAVLKKEIGKRLMIGAWISGTIATMLVIPTFRAIRLDIGVDKYTMICKYDNEVPLYRALFLSFNLIVYFIPSIMLTTIVVRIRHYIRSRRFVAHNRQCTMRSNSWRFRGTNMFLALIIIFILPYMLYMFYSAINMILRPQVSFTVDYVIRYTSGILAYCNAAIAPVIVFYSMRDMRKVLKEFLSQFECDNIVYPLKATVEYTANPTRIGQRTVDPVDKKNLPELRVTCPAGKAMVIFSASSIKQVSFYQITYSAADLKEIDTDGSVYY